MGLFDFLCDVKDAVCDKVEDAVDFVCENPIKSVGIVVVTVATGGVAASVATKAIAINSVIDYGNNKMGGGHDHRKNRGKDRTPSQKEGDMKRRKEG